MKLDYSYEMLKQLMIIVDFPISIYSEHKLILKVSFLKYGHDWRYKNIGDSLSP